MVRFSAHTAKAVAYLNRPYNDFDIFIEDSTCHNMILFIIKNILGENIRIETIIQLGGKEEVLKACRLDQDYCGRKKLYIIDGDLDILCGFKKPRLKHLYMLRCYCFENLILSEYPVLQLASEINTNTPPAQIEANFGYHVWLEEAVNLLTPLFITYAVIRTIVPTERTVNYSVFHLCKETASGNKLQKTKIFSRIRSLLRSAINETNLQDVIRVRKDCTERALSRSTSRHFCISAKDYIIPLLLRRVSKLVGPVGREDQFKTRLARFYEPKNEPYLARRLRSIANS